jgi:hypothetical protein
MTPHILRTPRKLNIKKNSKQSVLIIFFLHILLSSKQLCTVQYIYFPCTSKQFTALSFKTECSLLENFPHEKLF